MKTLLKLSFIMLFTSLLISCSLDGGEPRVLSEVKKQEIINKSIDNDDFIALFKRSADIGFTTKNGGRRNYFIDSAVKQYLDHCCVTLIDKIEFLKKEGFTVSQKYKYRNMKSLRKDRGFPYLENDIDYDEEIYAEMVRPTVYLYFHEYRKIIIFLKNDKVVFIMAQAFLDGI